ncbi:hypothetical protein EBU95_21350, partial [bacterium]|nr:hypothetical protein [bacterium]
IDEDLVVAPRTQICPLFLADGVGVVGRGVNLDGLQPAVYLPLHDIGRIHAFFLPVIDDAARLHFGENHGKHRHLNCGVVRRKFLPKRVGHQPPEQGNRVPEIIRPWRGPAEIGRNEGEVVDLVVYLQAHFGASPQIGEDVLGSPRQNEPVGVQEVIQGRDEVVQSRGVPERQSHPLASKMDDEAHLLPGVPPVRVFLGKVEIDILALYPREYFRKSAHPIYSNRFPCPC